ncbi:MAG: hypothetical protein Q8R78_06305, partial [Candidatus Omnitrophota bacterium]|nr:hypothetical protein [Candidatus Omnitrophota bacterium]
MRWQVLWRVLRTPVLLAAGWLWVAHSPTALPRLVMWQSRVNPFHDFYCAPPSTHDCFFFLPAAFTAVTTSARLLGYLLALWGVTEAARVVLSRVRRRWAERWVIISALGLAVAPWFLVEVRGPNIRLLPVMGGITLLLWLFVLLNVGLPRIEGLLTRPWVARAMAWTFPLSDIVAVGWYRRRLGRSAGWWRMVPSVFYLAMLGVIAAGQWRIVAASRQAERMPMTFYSPYQVVASGHDLWVAEGISHHDAGLWRYDGQRGVAERYLRVADLRTFALEDGDFYFYDGFDGTVRKVHAATSQLKWSVPIPGDAGMVDVAVRHGNVYVLGRTGYLALISLDGQILSTQRLPAQAWHLQVLPDQRAVFVSPDVWTLRLVGMDPTTEETIPLPLPPGVVRNRPLPASTALPVLVDVESVDQRHQLLVATLWGEIFRYDWSTRQWLPSLRLEPGLRDLVVDAQHGLIFAYNAARGYVEMLNLESGQHVAYV